MGMNSRLTRRAVSALLAALVALPLAQPASACTRTLYTGADGTVITGRSMDWSEDLVSNLWIFPPEWRATAPPARLRCAGPRSTAASSSRLTRPAAPTA